MSDNKWISVKECAALGKVSTQSVYKKLNHKNNQEIFTGHVRTIMGTKYLDEYAVSLILGDFRIGGNKNTIVDEVVNIMNELSEKDQKRILNFAKQALEVSKY